MSFSSNIIDVEQFITIFFSSLIKIEIKKNLIFWSKNDQFAKFFQTWWITTNHEQKNAVMKKTTKKKRRKLFWRNAHKTHVTWQNYFEIVRLIDDVSRFLCKKCKINITYSIFINNDFNSLINHFTNKNCLKIINSQYSTMNIKVVFQKICFISIL